MARYAIAKNELILTTVYKRMRYNNKKKTLICSTRNSVVFDSGLW